MSASKTNQINIVPHSKSWKLDFQNLAAIIRNLVGPTARRIDHIGSTAVEDLCAKDRIDIQITVASAEDFADIKDKLESGGFARASENSFDHIPAGCQLDESHWQKQFYRAPEGFRAMNLHVRVSGKANQEYPLLFRDFLRADKVVAEHYGKVKQQLAEHCGDIEAYCDIKDPVCDLIMHSAQRWAASIGWQMPESDA
ncbi:MAG: GrpB family protein [Candidatus Obscuribacterales bacterium]|nr:GrpB family protein [Candidatus Obscuribacterales bacterium]